MDKELWSSLQNISLGAERQPLKISAEARKIREENHRLSLVVKGLNPQKQPPVGIKNTLPKAWLLDHKVTSRINDDGTVQFFFEKEHQLLTVLDKGPWNFREWKLIVDRWTKRQFSDYLKVIPFWVRILNIPNDSRSRRMVEEVGGVLGFVEDVLIRESNGEQAGEVWIRVQVVAYERLIFARYFDFQDYVQPILIRYIFDKLKKFCTRSGALTHAYEDCDYNPVPQGERPTSYNMIQAEEEDEGQALVEKNRLRKR